MYGNPTPGAGIGVGVLATTGGGDLMLPSILAAIGLLIGGLMIVRNRWLQRQAEAD